MRGHFRRHRTGENALLRATSFLAKASDFSGVEPEKSLGLSLLLPRSLLCGLRALGRFRRHRTAEIARLRETPFHANAWGKLFVFRNAKCVSPQTPLRFWACIGAAAPSGRASRSSPRLRREWSLRSSASGGLKPFSEEKGFKTSKKTFFAARERKADASL